MERLKHKDEAFRLKFPMLFRNNDANIDERLELEDKFPAGGLMKGIKMPNKIENNFAVVSRQLMANDDHMKLSTRHRIVKQDDQITQVMVDLEEKLKANKAKKGRRFLWFKK
jgi:uncharacterized protein YueI